MTRTARFSSIAAGFCLLFPLSACRTNDAYEPNDTCATATPLTPGVELQATVGQSNPDVFALEAPAGKTAVFRVAGRGHEECPEFAVMGPKEQVLYRDNRGFCGDPPLMAEVQEKSVTVSGKKGSGYELRVTAAEAGKYFLTIQERKRPDNTFPFSWDYAITAQLE